MAHAAVKQVWVRSVADGGACLLRKVKGPSPWQCNVQAATTQARGHERRVGCVAGSGCLMARHRPGKSINSIGPEKGACNEVLEHGDA